MHELPFVSEDEGVVSWPAARLQYAVSPDKIPYSVPNGATSVVALTVTVTNGTGAAVSCRSLAFTISSGAGGVDLTLDPTRVCATVGVSSPWAAWPVTSGQWMAAPLPPAAGLADGEAAAFTLGPVVVNDVAGTTTIAVDEYTDAHRATTVDVTKNTQASGQAVPAIASFTAVPDRVALGGTTTISWKVTGATACVLDPGPIKLPSPTNGSLPLTVTEDTIYTLTAVGTGGNATATATVAVLPVAIGSFTAAPSRVSPGGAVTLTWATSYALACSIDQGVGPVETSGTVVVNPQQSTTYTLTTQGLQPLTRSVPVVVGT